MSSLQDSMVIRLPSQDNPGYGHNVPYEAQTEKCSWSRNYMLRIFLESFILFLPETLPAVKITLAPESRSVVT